MLHLDPKHLLSQLDNCQTKHIIVIGDVMLDEYHWCQVSRISPEAPVPVCRVDKTTYVPGGAANVAHNIACLSSTPELIGVYGKDSSGDRLKTALEDASLNSKGLIQHPERPTTLKSRIVAHQQHVVRVDRENAKQIEPDTETRLKASFDTAIASADAVLVSDYHKGTLTLDLLNHVMRTSRERGVPVVVDPKGHDYDRYKGATVLTPNFGEFQAVARKQLESENDVLEEGIYLADTLELDSLVVTRSEKGMSVISSQNGKLDIPAQAREVYDITGAGDTVIALITIGLAAGLSVSEAAFLGNYGASVVVAKVGTSTVSWDEIRTLIQRDCDG